MDPLSIPAGIIAITTVAAQVANLLAGIREDWDSLPGRMHALSNEIQDFNVVLQQVAIAVKERRVSGQDAYGESTLLPLLVRGNNVLVDLKAILERLLATGTKKKEAISRVLMWRREQGTVSSLQEQIKQVKSSLNVLLGASNSQDMMHVRLCLEELSLKISHSKEPVYPEKDAQDEFIQALLNEHHGTMEESLNRSYSQVDERLNKLEALLRAQARDIHTSQVTQVGRLYNASTPPARRRVVRAVSPASAARIQEKSASVGVRLRQARTTCQSTCLCSCHSSKLRKSPSFMDRMVGQLMLGYSGLPLLSTKCDSAACIKGQTPAVNVEYWFPLGVCWSQIIRLHLSYEANVGPSLQLSTLRRVPDSSQCVSYALDGNIQGLKSLFGQGLASPRDVSSTRGYSLLRWALYGQQYETCKFLMSAGADPTYKPIAPSDDCPSDKAGDIILRANISQEVIEILRLIAEGSDFNERQNFARIHKIVLGLCIGDLEEEIRQDPNSLDFPDGTGRTALQWAAARGDERAVVTLLSWGADPNNMDKKLNTPLTLAANQNQSVCVRLLLEAGALPDPELPPSVTFGTPLNCAARNAPDPVLMKTLLDFNAKIEASGVDGVAPLLHVARGNSAAHAMLLLEYGADINATSKAGQTPLTAAIQYNNHSVLKLLLERWFDYNECPRLKGPNLLETVARYADVETILLLTAAEHLRSYPDKTYILDHYKEVIDGRNDSSDELSVAFDELLSVLKMEAKAHGSIDELMESGLLNPLDYGIESEEDSSSDLLVFEDAKEMLDISSNSSSPIHTSCPAHDLEKSLEEKTGGNC
ncbi:ankyrin repeat-containing protein-like protein [Colletotrichum acutatum]|uniref:Ankyrin repeat-containing protein-like protein n=1 Tax=Glomerella acutata TaxID=27357 RepID=A0AAD8UQX8_GLOAC|nr:ankyrin repeat-containing protein-like protein [Colletotrichum acutatum]KAK1727818.1 ankyrin repeat-containing protein-like protein [Colletotrichum acutatum]